VSSSIFNLIAATFDSGTICFAYAIAVNGYVLGPLLVLLGALQAYYTSYILVKCAERTGKTSYEEIALQLYGKRASVITSWLNLACLVGFTFSYIVYLKAAAGQIVELFFDNPSEWLSTSKKGQVVWGLIVSYIVILPMSITRSVGALRYSSLFGVMGSIFLCLAVTILFFTDTDVVPDFSKNLKAMEAWKLSYEGVLKTFPLIIFSFMSQVNIPMIYLELEDRSAKKMGKVILMGIFVVTFFHTLIGIFGYATFANDLA
jgi:amino acid permease